MAAPKPPAALQELFDFLENDWKGLYRKYPDQAVFALGDKRVSAALRKRFEQDAAVHDIKAFQYNFQTGLNSFYFEFRTAKLGVHLSPPDTFLVLMDSACKVVGLIDPFDPTQPNAFMPPLPKEGEQPFVLSRPSITDDLAYREQEILPLQMRSREFFRRLADRRGGGADLIEIYGTTCNYTTRTPGDYWPDNNRVDDCGFPPILA